MRLGQTGTASRHSLLPGPSTRAFRSYDWDRAGRAVAIRDSHWGETRFAYDKRGQVVATGLRDRAGVEVARTGYDYDPARNLAAIHSLAGFAKVEQVKGGRTRARGQTFYRHDANGRVIEKRVEEPGFRPRIWRMAWNGEDRLVRLETPDGAVWAYAYDPLGRRIRRLKLVAGAKDENRGTPPGGGFAYQWDGDQIVAEAPIYADGTVAWDRAEAWVYEPGSFCPLAKLQGEDLYYVVTDHIGTPRELISEDGTRTAWRARLGLWGETEALTRRAANDNTAPDCPIRFQGQWFDEESGLHYNRFRYYDPEAGQYLSPDPIGLAGGSRPQAYVADTVSSVDPLGLNTCGGTTVPQYRTPFQPLTPNQRRGIQGRIDSRTATRNDYRHMEWDRRFSNRRNRGVSRFWAQERRALRSGQPGTRNWSPAQRADILAGRTPSHNGAPIEGHHRHNALDHPQIADDPTNIYPATRDEHFQRWHGGNWQNDTYGSPNNPSWPEEF